MQIINLIGHIGRDAEAKHIGERDYLSFSVACTERRNNEESTSWFSILYPYQETLAPYLKKGQQVFVSGRLKAGIYQNQQSVGIDLSVFAQTLQLCGGKKEETQTQQQVSASQQPQQTVIYPDREPVPFPAASDVSSEDSDGLPF